MPEPVGPTTAISEEFVSSKTLFRERKRHVKAELYWGDEPDPYGPTKFKAVECPNSI